MNMTWMQYQVATFLDKNKDAVRPDLLELLQGSTCAVSAIHVCRYILE